MENYKLKITEQGVFINETLINEKIFQKEEIGYLPIEREQQINDLYIWIGEAIESDRASDLYLMKEDLHYLESLEDEFIFSSIFTNNFIAKSDDRKEFNAICKDILKINKESK